MDNNIYKLPYLPYKHNELEPYISEEQLRVHHEKLHQGYVSKINNLMESMEAARDTKSQFDAKCFLKDVAFNLGGHTLHTLFWANLAPPGKGGGGSPKGKLKEAIEEEFGSEERFKKEFTEAALSVEGSGWVTLALSFESCRLLINQIEKHQVNVYPESSILMILDMWEHAYFVDYKAEKEKYVEGFWNIVDWQAAEDRFEASS